MIRSILRTIRHQIVIKHLSIPAKGSLLDTSCGDGSFLKILFAKHNTLNIFGIDCNLEAINKAQINLPQGTFMNCNIEKTPFQNEQFEAVLHVFTLHHINDPTNVFNELKRITSKSGTIYLVDIAPRNYIMKKVLNMISCPEPYHFEQFYTLDEVEKLAISSGLQIVSKKQIFVWPLIRFGGNVGVFKLSTSTNE